MTGTVFTVLAVGEIQGAVIDRVRRLVHGFRKRRMRMNRALNVFRRCIEFEREHGLGNQLARHRADDVHTEDLVVVFR